MHIVDEPLETVHLYVVKEEPKQSYTLLPLLAAFACLAAIASLTVYSGQHPAYEHQTLIVPAQLLPPQTFTASVKVTPTGVKTYPATTAHGVLTITNGSVITQILPAGFTTVSNSGVSVVTDEAVFVPAGNANGYGWATVGAHAVAPGASGNIPSVAIDRVEGTSLYIRNLSAFTGGNNSRTVTFATPRDKQTALLQARGILALQINGLHYPCSESYLSGAAQITLTWRCQFVRYSVPSYMHVTAVRLSGKNLIIDVWYLPPVRPVRMR